VLLIGADPFLLQSSDRLIALAAQHRIPAVYNTREFVAGGGLIKAGNAATTAPKPTRLATLKTGSMEALAPASMLAREAG